MIKKNTQRYIKLFSQAVDEQLPAPNKDITAKEDVLDVISFQREERNAQNEDNGETTFPANLLRR
jgi:DNA replication licensing factor MCM7